jgi:hypothetical protein
MIGCEPALQAAGSPSVALFGSILAGNFAVMAMTAAGLLAAAVVSLALLLLLRATSLSALVLLIRLTGALSLIAFLSRAVRTLIAVVAVGHVDTPRMLNRTTTR